MNRLASKWLRQAKAGLKAAGDSRERMDLFSAAAEWGEGADLPVESLVYTPQEYDDLKSSRNPFIHEVLKRGLLVDC